MYQRAQKLYTTQFCRPLELVAEVVVVVVDLRLIRHTSHHLHRLQQLFRPTMVAMATTLLKQEDRAPDHEGQSLHLRLGRVLEGVLLRCLLQDKVGLLYQYQAQVE